LLYRRHEVLGVSESARLLDVGRSTAHRLMTTLQRHQFVVQDAASRAYRAGPALRELGATVSTRVDLRGRCRPYLESLSEEVGETANLVVLRSADALFLDSVESRRPLRVGSREGVVLPAYAVSAGKALLATLPTEHLHQLLPDARLAPVTRRTLRTRAALERELEQIRKRGYAINDGESEPEITAVGAAVPGLPGGERVAVAISAPASRVHDRDDIAVMARAVSTTAMNIARGVGTAAD
jgi:DNA-binding IclR family transcriptional regulator